VEQEGRKEGESVYPFSLFLSLSLSFSLSLSPLLDVWWTFKWLAGMSMDPTGLTKYDENGQLNTYSAFTNHSLDDKAQTSYSHNIQNVVDLSTLFPLLRCSIAFLWCAAAAALLTEEGKLEMQNPRKSTQILKCKFNCI
jgi:hypothetical protein